MSYQLKSVIISLLFVGIKTALFLAQNETIEFSSDQEVFVGESAVLEWSLEDNLLQNIADIKFGLVTRLTVNGERLDAILVKKFPSGRIQWNVNAPNYVSSFVRRTEVIPNKPAAFKIAQVKLNDSSEFYCTVTQVGTSQTMITDYVKIKVIDIQILNATSSMDVVSWKGHKIRIHCNVRVVPNTPTSFIWRNKAKDGTIVDPSKQHNTRNSSQLTIITYTDEQFGPYECVAMTASTEHRHEIRIIRIYEPSEPGNFSQHRRLTSQLNCSVVVKLSWMSPLKDGGAPVTHYMVEYKPSDQEWESALRKQVDTNHIGICRPPRGQGGDGLHVRVRAKNKVGVGKPSSPTIVTFWDEPTSPRNLKPRLRRDLGEPFIELSWDYPLDDGGVRVSTYHVEYKPLDAAWSNAAKLVTPEQQINIWKTSKDENIYQVRIRAINGVGFSDTSNILKVAFADAPSRPWRVMDKKVLHPTLGPPHIHLHWKRPMDDGGLSITNYRIEYMKVTQREWKLAKSAIVTEEKYVIKDVDKNQQYKVRVSAQNKMGLGQWSRTVVVRYKEKLFVAFKAQSRGPRLLGASCRELALVLLLATAITKDLCR